MTWNNLTFKNCHRSEMLCFHTDMQFSHQLPSIININQITAEEDEDNFIYQIREELIENVMKHVDVIEDKHRLIKFVANCAYDALTKLLTIEFYHHSPVINPTEGAWVPDKPLMPSEPDTWAANNIPIIPKYKMEESVVDKPREEPQPVCTCSLGVICECHKKLEERILQLESLENLEPGESGSSATSGSNISLTQTPSEESLTPPVSVESEDLGPEVIEPDPDKCDLGGVVKIDSVQTLVLPKINIATTSASEFLPQSKIVVLPPIRVSAHFDGKPEEDKKRRGDKKKKQ
ncbi:unnamed protein product [Acanthoscelides obtectus]|uniref:Uncharacterized protein n=1 Tax=Acanthoscelides obtectus TaxID=200917 RepID=A0A9P0PSG9_ACAOB|nr:unnamed protein product [Acanthoscelides obtectus]CAK1671329.1 hypothetical protein AOBTE_LOCUS28225 [Acanthoscelides obtectus]